MLVKGVFTNISGSIGGVTGSHNKGGQYLRARTTPVNPNSAAQQLTRSAFSDATTAWSALSATNRTAWNDYAAAQSWTNALGDPIQLSGQQAYVGSYSGLMSAGLATVTTPPVPNTRPSAYVIENMIPNGADGDVGMSMNAGGLLVGDRYVIAVSAPLPPGLTSPKVPFRIMGTTAGNSDGQVMSNDIYSALVARTPGVVEGMRWAVQIRAIRAAGNYSPHSTRITQPWVSGI